MALLLAGGQPFALCTAWQGGRRPTSDVKTARQTLSSVTLVTQCVIYKDFGKSHGMPVNRAVVESTDIVMGGAVWWWR